MRNKPQIRRLRAYLEQDLENKKAMASYFKVAVGTIESWLSRGSVPKTLAQFIFRYINEEQKRKKA